MRKANNIIKNLARGSVLLFLFTLMWPVGVQAQDVTVKSYMTSEADLQDASKYYLPHAVTWNSEQNAAEFKGGTYDAWSGKSAVPMLVIKDAPFELVNEETGFTISFEFKGYANGSGAWARFLDANDILVENIGKGANPSNTFGFTLLGAALSNANYQEHHIHVDMYNNGSSIKYFRENWRTERFFAEDDPDKWHTANFIVTPKNGLRFYIDGILRPSYAQKGQNHFHEAVLAKIKTFNSIYIGRSAFERNKDGYFKGYMRNLQIVSSAKVELLKLKNAVPFGRIKANSVAVTTAGTLAPLGGQVTLVEEPDPGYHLDWSSVTYQSKTDTKATAVDASTHVFTMPDFETVLTGEFKQNTYTIEYNWNLGTGDNLKASDGTVINNNPDGSVKSHFGSFTINNVDPTLTKADGTKWQLKGWSTTKDATNPDVEVGTTYPVGSDGNNTLNGVKDGDIVTLYPVWEEKQYTISVDPAMFGGTVTLKIDGTTTSSTTSLKAKHGNKIIVTAVADESAGYGSVQEVTKREGSAAAQAIEENDGYSFTVGEEDVVVNAVFKGKWAIKLSQELDAGREIWVAGRKLTTSAVDLIIGNTLTLLVKSTDPDYRLEKFYYKVKTEGQADYGEEIEIANDGTSKITYDVSTGEYTVKITENKGEMAVRATFVEKAELSSATGNDKPTLTIDGGAIQTWTGSAITPSYTLKKGTAEAASGEFAVEFTDNVAPGQATAKIIAKNSEKYKGEIKVDAFQIKCDLAYAEVIVNDKTYTGQPISPGQLVFSVRAVNGTNEVKATADEFEVKQGGYPSPNPTNVGTYDVTLKAKDGSNIFMNEKTVPFNIVAADLDTYVSSYNVTAGGRNGTTYNLITPAADNVKLKVDNSEYTLSTNDYRVIYMKADGTELDGTTVPAGTLGTYYVAIASKGANTVGYKLTNTKATFQIEATLSNKMWATYYDERYNLEVPSGYKAYKINSVNVTDGYYVKVDELTYIPKKVPVLLKQETVTGDNATKTVYFDEAVQGDIPSYSADFKGVESSKTSGLSVTGMSNVFVLYGNHFVRTESGSIPANRAYLVLDSEAANLSRMRLSIRVGDDDTTGIDELETESADIIPDNTIFDLSGRRLQGVPTKKGIYIVNGKKQVVK